MEKETSSIVCKNCANRLTEWCYAQNPWFRLIREPLVLCLRIMALLYGVKSKIHVHNPECENCIRFMKTELQRRSALFRFLNNTIGKGVSRLRDSMLTPEELAHAKLYAQESPWDMKK